MNKIMLLIIGIIGGAAVYLFTSKRKSVTPAPVAKSTGSQNGFESYFSGIKNVAQSSAKTQDGSEGQIKAVFGGLAGLFKAFGGNTSPGGSKAKQSTDLAGAPSNQNFDFFGGATQDQLKTAFDASGGNQKNPANENAFQGNLYGIDAVQFDPLGLSFDTFSNDYQLA